MNIEHVAVLFGFYVNIVEAAQNWHAISNTHERNMKEPMDGNYSCPRIPFL
jgi:hypothetical protein